MPNSKTKAAPGSKNLFNQPMKFRKYGSEIERLEKKEEELEELKVEMVNLKKELKRARSASPKKKAPILPEVDRLSEELNRTLVTSTTATAVQRQRRASLQVPDWTPEPRWSFNHSPEQQHQLDSQQYMQQQQQQRQQYMQQQRRYSQYE